MARISSRTPPLEDVVARSVDAAGFPGSARALVAADRVEPPGRRARGVMGHRGRMRIPAAEACVAAPASKAG